MRISEKVEINSCLMVKVRELLNCVSREKYCLRDIETCKNDIIKYESQLQTEIEKSNSRDIPAILDFLAKWKERVYSFYKNDLEQYFEEKANLKKLYNEFSKLSYAERYELGDNSEYHKARHNLYCKLNGYKERKTFTNHWGKEDYHDVKVRDGEWEHLKHYLERCDTLDGCLKLLDKEIPLFVM